MKTNHTADEIVTIEGPQDHSLDIERVRTVIDDEMHRVGVVYVTFHFVHNRKHKTHSDDFAPSDNWFPVFEELFDEVTAVYKVTIQPSDRLGKAKRMQGNPGNLKITGSDFAQLRQAIEVVIGELPRIRAAVKSDPRVKDPAKRARWDLLYLAQREGALPSDWFSRVYKYADDDNIDSALRQIVKSPLENPREHRSTSKQGHYVANLLRNPVLESGATFDASDAEQVAKEARALSHL